MPFLRLLCLLLAPASLVSAAAPQLGLADGEALTYRVSWVILPGAGEITVTAKGAADPTGQPLLRVVTTTSTRGFAHLLLPFNARAESLYAPSTGRLVWLGETSSTRGKHAAHTLTFDYEHSRASYTEGSDAPRMLELPPGLPMDLINCLVRARTWNLRPGSTQDAVVLFEDDIYQLTVHALGYEDISTGLGDFHTLVLEPRMEKTPPQGMFKRGSTVKVWIAQDARHLPVRFKVEFRIGSGVATLAAYRPPSAEAK